jgi:hypothetical protein
MPIDLAHDHELVLAYAAEIGLSTDAPFDRELLTAYRHIRALTDRLPREWPPEAEPAYSFSSLNQNESK